MINIIPTLTVMDKYKEYDEMIKNYINSDSTIFRCNATRFDNKTYIDSINTLQEIYFNYTSTNFNLILDIPCPKEKIRIEYLSSKNDIIIEKNQELIITENRTKLGNNIFYADLPIEAINVGDKIIIGDGDLSFLVKSKLIDSISCISLNTGKLGLGKAVYTNNIICCKSSEATIQSKIELIKELKPTYIALSFVESKDEISQLRNRLKKINNYNPIIISKIETQKGVDNLSELIKESQGVMIARGDLALSAGYDLLYKNQNEIINKCNLLLRNKQIYIASEIMNSLVDSITPTRSDVCDLSNIIEKGIKNIILSGPLCRYNNYNIAVDYIKKIFNVYS